MSFARQVLMPKQAYDSADHAEAEEILARRKLIEPRCNADSTFCLKLRSQGEFVHYNGVGPDAGKTFHASFLMKGSNRLRLAYFAPNEFASNAEILAVMSRAVKDALQGMVTSVYWYVKDNDPQSLDKEIFSELAARIAADWPSLNVSVSSPAGFTRWEASQ